MLYKTRDNCLELSHFWNNKMLLYNKANLQLNITDTHWMVLPAPSSQVPACKLATLQHMAQAV